MINKIRFWLIRKLAGDRMVGLNLVIVGGGFRVDASDEFCFSNIRVVNADTAFEERTFGDSDD